MYYYSHATLPPPHHCPLPRHQHQLQQQSKHQPVLHSPGGCHPLSLQSLVFVTISGFSVESIIPTQGLWLQSIKYFYINLQIFCRTIEEKSDLEKTFYSLEVFNIGGDCNIFYLSSVILFPEDGSYIDRWYTNYVFTSSQHHLRILCLPALSELDFVIKG